MKPIDKLKPYINDEWCNCDHRSMLMVSYVLCDNPFMCYDCGKQVAPESLSLSDEEIDCASRWNSVYGALYKLWLDSGEYENWAKEKLLDRMSDVNIHGLTLIALLKKKHHVFYEWFWDTDDEFYMKCPNCGNGVVQDDNEYTCLPCMIMVRT